MNGMDELVYVIFKENLQASESETAYDERNLDTRESGIVDGDYIPLTAYSLKQEIS
jgi:hypothetical protein